MAFRKMVEIQEEKYAGKFVLKNDGDSMDVVFLYRSEQDVLSGPAHYIKSHDYSGYVECLGNGCPACANNLRVQEKVFIPCFVPDTGEVLLWDRSPKFYDIFKSQVFSAYPNPYEYVFRVTRNIDTEGKTKYSIIACAKNPISWEAMLKTTGIKEDAYGNLDVYSRICKEVDAVTMANMLNASGDSLPVYQPTPRASVTSASPVENLDTLPDVSSTFTSDDDLDDVDFD